MADHWEAGAGYATPPTPRRRRRRWPWVLLSVVVLMLGLAVAVDRVALVFAEHKAASSLQSSQHLASTPDVSVAGFPFLTQLARGEFDSITVSANGIRVGSAGELRLDHVVVHLHHVTVPSDYSSVRADSATADAYLTFGDLTNTLGFPVHSGRGGRIVAAPSVTLFGQQFSARVSAVVHASSVGGITFADPQVSSGGITLPGGATTALASVFGKAISLAGIPFDVAVDGVSVSSSGLDLRLSGHNLVYQR